MVYKVEFILIRSTPLVKRHYGQRTIRCITSGYWMVCIGHRRVKGDHGGDGSSNCVERHKPTEESSLCRGTGHCEMRDYASSGIILM